MATSDGNLSHDTSASQTLFISYAHEDIRWAEWVGSALEVNGHSVILASWDFRPGTNFVLEMDDAVKKCDRVMALLSPAFILSQYTQPEWAAAFAQDPTGRSGRLIPVRVEDCFPEGLLSQVVYVDLVGLDEASATKKLLAAVSGERLKPLEEAPFPGYRLEEDQELGGEPDIRYAQTDYPDTSEEEGFVDYVIRGTSSIEEGNSAASRFSELIRVLADRLVERAGQFTKLGQRRARASEFKGEARATARDMRQFVTDSQQELERMAVGWETGLAAWRRTIDLLPELGEVDEAMLTENLTSIDSMRAAIPLARRGVQRMLDSTQQLPRIEGAFIAARNQVASVLETAIRILDRTAHLADQVHDSAIETLPS